MTLQAAHSFRQRVQEDTELQQAVARHVLNGVIDFDALVRLGAETGYQFSAADAQAALAEEGDSLSDFELELVSGGTTPTVRSPLSGDHSLSSKIR